LACSLAVASLPLSAGAVAGAVETAGPGAGEEAAADVGGAVEALPVGWLVFEQPVTSAVSATIAMAFLNIMI